MQCVPDFGTAGWPRKWGQENHPQLCFLSPWCGLPRLLEVPGGRQARPCFAEVTRPAEPNCPSIQDRSHPGSMCSCPRTPGERLRGQGRRVTSFVHIWVLSQAEDPVTPSQLGPKTALGISWLSDCLESVVLSWAKCRALCISMTACTKPHCR